MNTGAVLLSAGLSFCAGVLGAVATMTFRGLWPAHPDDTFAILFTGLIAAVVGAVAVVAAVWGTISARKIARIQTTFEHIAALESDATLQQARQGLNLIVRSGVDIARYAEREREGDPGTRAIVTVLNEYELVSIGIQRGIIDAELYRRWTYSSVVFDWESVQPFVMALRRRTGRQLLFHEFEEMVRWMSQNRLPPTPLLVGGVLTLRA